MTVILQMWRKSDKSSRRLKCKGGDKGDVWTIMMMVGYVKIIVKGEVYDVVEENAGMRMIYGRVVRYEWLLSRLRNSENGNIGCEN